MFETGLHFNSLSMQTLKSHPLSLKRLCDKDEMSSSISSKTVQCHVPHRAWPFPLHVHPCFSHAFELQQCSSEHYKSVLKCALSVFLKCVGYVKGLFCFPLSQLLAWFFTALPTDLVRLVLVRMPGRFQRWDLNDGTVRLSPRPVSEVHAQLACELFKSLLCLGIRF